MPSAALPPLKRLCCGLGIVVGKQGLCFCDKIDTKYLIGVEAVDFRGRALNSLNGDLALVLLHSGSVLVEERDYVVLLAVDGSVDVGAALRTALLTLCGRLAAALGGSLGAVARGASAAVVSSPPAWVS